MLTEELIREVREIMLPSLTKTAEQARTEEAAMQGTQTRVVTMNMLPDRADALVEYVRMLEDRDQRLTKLVKQAMEEIRKLRKEK